MTFGKKMILALRCIHGCFSETFRGLLKPPPPPRKVLEPHFLSLFESLTLFLQSWFGDVVYMGWFLNHTVFVTLISPSVSLIFPIWLTDLTSKTALVLLK